MRKLRAFLCVSFILCSYHLSFAKWTEPELLSELNDAQSSAIATRPAISSDGSMIYFVRYLPSEGFYLYEGIRDQQTVFFSTQRVVSELGMYQGRNIYTTWLSEDSLRLYASITRYNSPTRRWENPIYMAVRNSVEDTWVLASSTPVIYYGESDASQSLTSDELLIMWESRSTQESPFIIYQAVRESTDQPFVNISEVSELNALGAKNPCLTPDGLCVYFSILSADGFDDIWRGFRSSLSEPFGDFEPMTDINRTDTNENSPSVSPDGKALYFFRGSPSLPVNERGIFVSYWVDTAYEITLKTLQEAIEAKEEAQALLAVAMEKEKEALSALAKMKAGSWGTPQNVSVKDIHKARLEILYALQRQVVANMNLKSSLLRLQKALGLISVEEPVKASPENEKKAEKETKKDASVVTKNVGSASDKIKK